MIRIEDNTWALRPLRFDAGLQFGRAVFETILVLRRPVFWEEHICRLNSGLLELSVRAPVDSAWLRRQVSGLAIADCVLKVLVSAENIVLQTRALPRADAYENVRLTAVPDPRPRDRRLLRCKSSNYLANLLAYETAAKEGFSDALFISENNLITECSRSNIFWLQDNRLYTPSDDCGLLPGIVRQWLGNRFPVSFGKYEKNNIFEADAVMMTNSVIGVRAVAQIDGHEFSVSGYLEEIIQAWHQEILGPAG